MSCITGGKLSFFGAGGATTFRRRRGFTLFELMVVMAIGAILAALAIPSMRTFVLNQRQSSAAGSLVYSLSYGRSEAIKEDLSTAGVTVCASSNQTTCDPAGNWSNGWIVLPPTAVSTLPLQVVGALPTGQTMTTTPATPSIAFISTGQTSLPTGAGSFVMFKLCDSRGASFAREVEINPSGHVQAAATPGFQVNGTTALTCP